MSQWFEQLQQDRREWLASTRRNKFERGIFASVVDKYPDPVHFVYELLQNAEDQSASQVRIRLERERLIFEHNGQPFTSRDVVNITGIGNTQKSEQANKIGRFGMGFKSVLVITERPEIYTSLAADDGAQERFAFAVENLVVPERIAGRDEFNYGESTIFCLPFKPADRDSLFRQIGDKLRSLGGDVLLFLRCIRRIEWATPEESGSYSCEGEDGGRVKLSSEILVKGHKPERRFTRYLVRERGVEWIETDRQLYVQVAFLLDNKGRISEDAGAGRLDVFFPTHEQTNLKFRLHGPFLLTENRANVKQGDPLNTRLVEELGTLIADSLNVIRDAGLLSRSFLAVLTNEGDEIPALWSPIFESVVRAFKTCDLLPTADGRFVRAAIARRGDRAIRDVILANDLCFLTGEDELYWAVDVPVDDKRVSAFLEALGLSKFSWEELVRAIGRNCCRRLNILKFDGGARWLRGKDESWFGRFYALLDKAFEETKDNSDVNYLLNVSSIIRLADGSFTSGVEHPYFSPTMRLPKGLDFPHVDDSIFDGKKPKQAESARRFLIKVGVKEVNEEEVVKNLIATFYDGSTETAPDDHLQHIKLFMDWSAKAKSYDVFKEANLFLSSDGILSKPAALYLDSPFVKTGLAALFSPAWQHKRPRRPLWPGYLEKVQAAAFVEFAEQIGVISKIGIVRFHRLWPEHRLYQEWGRVRRNKKTEEGREFWIHDLDTWLLKPTLQASLLIWAAMAAEAPETFTARYRPNAFRDYREAPSFLIVWLKTKAWIPNRTGEFKRPADLSRGTLHPDFKYDNRNGWLDAIGFGATAKAGEAEVVARREAAEKIGVAPELAEELRVLSSEQQKDWLDLIKASKRRGFDFPEDDHPNSQLRSRRAEEQAARAVDVEREQRPRRIRKTSNRPDVREYLSQKYTRDGRLFCQMSQEPVPFALPSGEPYFVAVEVFPLGKEIVANHLCLSPTCAAEFRHALLTDDNDLRARILKVVPDANQTLEIEVEVPLPEHRRIRFVRRHLTDLQAAIRVCGQ